MLDRFCASIHTYERKCLHGQVPVEPACKTHEGSVTGSPSPDGMQDMSEDEYTVTTQVSLWLLDAIEHIGTANDAQAHEVLGKALSVGQPEVTVEYACQLAHALVAGMKMRVEWPASGPGSGDPEEAARREFENLRATLKGEQPPNYFTGRP